MNWWRRLTRKPQLERQLDAELRFDFDRTVAGHIHKGMSEAEARRTAALQFGGMEQVKEKCRDARGTRWLDTTVQDVRFACRQLQGNPAFTSVAILALALGIGANTAVFTVVNGVLLRPLPFPEPDRLLLISRLPVDFPFHLSPSLVESDYLSFRQQDRLFERVATFHQNLVNVTGGGEPIRASCVKATPEFFSTLRVQAATGRTFLADEDQPGRDHVAVLSDSLWRSYYGADPKLLGKTATLDGEAYRVIGVMPATFNFPAGAELWTPAAIHASPHSAMFRPVVGRLRPGVSRQRAKSELDALARGWEATAGNKTKLITQVISLKELLVGDVRQTLLIFAGAVAFVLLIACANVANLLLIRAAARQHEVAVRAALGASRGRLIRQMLTESTLISLFGGALGLLLALWAAPALMKLAPEGTIPRTGEIHIDGWVLAFTFGISALNGVVFGLAPALRATRRPLRESMSHAGRTMSGRHEALRSVLVVAEIALALVLLTGAGLMIKSFVRMRSADSGFHAENVVTMTVDLPASVYRTTVQMREFRTRILARLSSLPGTATAGSVDASPLNQGLTMGDFHVQARKLPPGTAWVDKLNVSPGYFRTMGIRLESGRDFTDGDTVMAPGVVIVSRSVARTVWPGENPVGKVLTQEDHPKPADWLTVVGVVDEVKQQGLSTKFDAALYQPYLQVQRAEWLNHMTFAVRTAADPESVAKAMRAVLHEVDSQQPARQIATMTDLIAKNTAEPLFQARLLAGFSMLALALAAIGIYGVLAYSVTERTHEIGIRMALGAGRSQVIGMVLRRAAVLTAIGVVLGTAGALAVTGVLEKLLYDVKPNDPATFAAVAIVLGLVALMAGLIPARRATRVDPLTALRWE